MLENGTIIDGKYEILSKVGQGGMSIVYLALNRKANKQWAIKEVRKDGVKDFELVRQSLVVETDMLKRLSHPNLPSIVDIIDEDGRFLIVMDYIEGKPLSAILKEYGPQPQSYVLEWAIQLCDVLEYLHTRKPPIIYRDMKPSNVMLKPDGTVVLIDFGTAREYKERNVADTTCLGTLGYAAPEQFGGHGQTDARTDVYCLGATLYHLLTGKSPAEPPYQIKPIREWNPQLSKGLEAIILQCTEQDPRKRFQSCAELKYALEHSEEYDAAYQKQQRKKAVTFLVTMGLSVLCGVSAVLCLFGRNTMRDKNYQALIEAGEYKQAIAMKPETTDAYEAMIRSFKTDGAFTTEEERQLNSVITASTGGSGMQATDRDALIRVGKYDELAFEIGILYSCYYQYGGQETTPLVCSAPWFRIASDEVYGNDKRELAYLYYQLAAIYEDSSNAIIEGREAEDYTKAWTTMTKIVQYLKTDKSIGTYLRLQLYYAVQYSIYKDASKLAQYLEQGDVNTLLGEMETAVKALDLKEEATIAAKDRFMQQLPKTKESITVAYGKQGVNNG